MNNLKKKLKALFSLFLNFRFTCFFILIMGAAALLAVPFHPALKAQGPESSAAPSQTPSAPVQADKPKQEPSETLPFEALSLEEEKDFLEKALKESKGISTKELSDFEKEVAKLDQDFKAFQATLLKKKRPSSWNRLKIDNFLTTVQTFSDKRSELQENYQQFKQESKTLLELIQSRREAYKKIKKSSEKISEQETFIEPEAFKKVQTLFKQKTDEIKKLQESYLQSYQNLQKSSEAILQVKKQLEAEKEQFQASLFLRTHPPLYAKGFWQNKSLRISEEIQNSWNNLIEIQPDKLKEDSFRYTVLLGLFLIVYFLLRKLKKDYQFPNPPLALAFLFTLLCASFLIQSPAAWLNVLVWALLPFFLYHLVKSYQFPKTHTQLFLALFVAYTCVRIVEEMDFPILIYRLFIIAFAGFMSVIALYQYFRLRKMPEKTGIIELALVLSAPLFAMISFSDFVGYHVWSIFLLHGFIKTAFLLFSLLFFKKVFYQFLFFLLQLPQIKNIGSLYKNRNYILKKLSHLLLTVLLVIIALWLPAIWQYYSSFSESAQSILAFKLPLGDGLELKMLLEALLIFYLAHFVAFILCALLQSEVYPRKAIDRGVGNSINSLIKYSLLILGTFLAFFALGFQLQQLAIIAGALSVGIGFGLQNIINNFVSGIILLFERPIKVGDLLDINGQWGEVEKVGLRSTVIRTFSKTQLIIPNSSFITETVTNLTLSDSDYRVIIPIGIAYGSNLEQAQQALLEIVKAHPAVCQEPEALVVFKEFGDSSLNFEILFWLKDISQRTLTSSEILFAIDKKFRELKIEIPFPQRDLHIKSWEPVKAAKDISPNLKND